MQKEDGFFFFNKHKHSMKEVLATEHCCQTLWTFARPNTAS